ncbi:MAG: hypothetical protein ACO3YY_02960, partial [Phycisphaerales bacterium]
VTKKGKKPASFKELRSGPLGPRAMGITPRRAGSRNPRRTSSRPGRRFGGSGPGEGPTPSGS